MSAPVFYLDHAAATPLDERVLLAMQPYFRGVFYNPSASYEGGRQARQALDNARRSIALLLGAKEHDVIFTAGATESINLALGGVLDKDTHAVIGATEHAAVYAAINDYPHTIAGADKHGLIPPEAVQAALRDNTIVVSVALADSEFGTVQPIAAIAAVLEAERLRRREAGNPTPLYLHSDGSQAAGALELKVSRLGVDMLTLNAAKCYGPKQVGVLWARPTIRLKPLIGGGGQERGLRSGTENVAGVVGFARALELVQRDRHVENERLSGMRKELCRQLIAKLPELVVDGHQKRHLPGHLHIHVDGLDAERVVFHLDMAGVAIATGAACAANKSTRSPALEAIGLSASQADGSLRISLGHLNQAVDIPVIAEKIINAIETERRL